LECINKVCDSVSDTNKINNDDEITNKLTEICNNARINNDIENDELENKIKTNLTEMSIACNENNNLQNEDNTNQHVIENKNE